MSGLLDHTKVHCLLNDTIPEVTKVALFFSINDKYPSRHGIVLLFPLYLYVKFYKVSTKISMFCTVLLALNYLAQLVSLGESEYGNKRFGFDFQSK